MPRISISQKQHRVVVFLLGALQSDNFEQLGDSGFDLADWEQGLSLLKRSAALTMSPAARASPNTNEALASLEAFERRWVPIAEATFEARFPELFERVFAGYRRESGAALVVTMSVLADRLASVAASERPDDRAAMDLLARRGLTGEVLAEMQATLARALAVPSGEAAPSAPSADERAEAEQQMWRWYLEWSRIARTAIADRTALRRLGFLRRARGDAHDLAPPQQPVLVPKQLPALPPAPASTPAP